MDTDPNFGRYRYFCGTIINVRTDRNPHKRLHRNNSEKDAVIWIGFIEEYILVEEILVPKNASIIFVIDFSKRLN